MKQKGIEKEVVRFLEGSKKDLIVHFSKEIARLGLGKDKKIASYFNAIFQSLIDVYEPNKKEKIDINRALHEMVEYIDDKQYDVSSLVKIATDLRYILVKALFLSEYDKTTQYQIWVALINRIDWLQTQLLEYSFALYKQDKREAEAKFRTMVEKIQEGLLIVDNNLEVQFCNQSFCKILQQPHNTIIGKKIGDFVPEKEYETISKGLKKLITGELERGFFELYIVDADGAERCIEITPSLISEEKKVVGFQATVRDVTERRDLERKLKDRYEKMQQAYLELGKVNRQMASLIDISSILSTDLEPNEVFEFILSSIAILAEADTATLRKYNENKKTLDLISTYKMQYMWDKARSLKVNSSVSGHTILHHESIKVDDISKDKAHKYLTVVIKSDLKATYALPLMVVGNPVGTLSLYSYKEGNFNDLNEELIAALVGQASIALKVLF